MYLHYKKLLKVLLVIALTALVLPLQIFAAASGTHTPVAGIKVVVSGATDNSMSNGAITVTAKGSGGVFGIGASAKTATITVTNELDTQAKISFDWAATSVNQLKIDGTVYSGTSGSFSKIVDGGGNFTLTITTAKNSTVNKLVMSSFSIVRLSNEEKNVTVQFDANGGSVTVGGTSVANDQKVVFKSEAQELVATTKSGYVFLGWVDTTEENSQTKDLLLNSAATYSLTATSDMTVTAVFAKKGTGSAWFSVDGKYLTDNLNKASTLGTTIVLMNDGTLCSGDYTINSGDTLLIPYNDAHTLCRESPVQTDSYVKPTAFRTLIMQEGANIIVNGELSLSAEQCATKDSNGQPKGPVSVIRMNSGSTITVNSGAKLYAWGYIAGSGAVTIKSGGTVYEDFQLADFRGGDGTSQMTGSDGIAKRVFPMSQYYVQNVQVPMTLEAGAIEQGSMSVSVSIIGIKGATVPFVGTNNAYMFSITSGYIVKYYDDEEDRQIINVYGDIAINKYSINIPNLLMDITIKSQNYEMPLTNNMTVNLKSGITTADQNLALLPGSQINIDSGATLKLGAGVSMFVYDVAQWGNYCNSTNKPLIQVKNVYQTGTTNAPGAPVKRDPANLEDAQILVNGTLDASAGYVYTTNGPEGEKVHGAAIISEDTGVFKAKVGTATETYQATQSTVEGGLLGTSQKIDYVPIFVTIVV